MKRRSKMFHAMAVVTLPSLIFVNQATAFLIHSFSGGVFSNNAHAPVGSEIEIDFFISGLIGGSDPSVGSFDLILRWDDTRFDFHEVIFGKHLGDPNVGESTTNVVELGVTGFDSAGFAWATFAQTSNLTPAELHLRQPGVFQIATASFDVLGLNSNDGTDVIRGEFGFGFANPISGVQNFVRDAFGNDLQGGFTSATALPVVPLPSAAWMGLALLGGVGSIAGIRRRMRRAA